MIPYLRSRLNAAWTPEKYTRLMALLQQRFGEPACFRHSETPCFLTYDLVTKACRSGAEIVQQLVGDPNYMAASAAAIPEAYRTPGDPQKPLFVQADFGIDGEGNLQLVEIQGFPSLYAYQPVLAEMYRTAFDIEGLQALPGGLDMATYENIFRTAVIGSHDPENVVLLEVDPWQQKTRHDFVATRDLLGLAITDAREVIRKKDKLFYRRGTGLVPIERIYNRVIADELEQRCIQLPFEFRDDLQVEWAGHPNWFYRLSKFSLPYISHPTVPAAFLLSNAPTDIEPQKWVLKPLYSFAGSGVIIGPTQADLAAIPREKRDHFLLQKRVQFQPVIQTPEGLTKIEIRVMYVWLEELQPVNLIIRMGRGGQMGVDHNKGMGWVGASAAFIEEKQA